MVKNKLKWTGFANAIFFDAVCSGFDVRLIAFRKCFAGPSKGNLGAKNRYASLYTGNYL